MTGTDNDISRIHESMKQSFLHIFLSESDDDAEKKWLLARTSNERIRKEVTQLSVLSLHVLDIINGNKGIKGVDIARELKVTKGAVSKVTRKLTDLGFVEKSQLPTNLKEIYFSVTPLGAELAKLHEDLHRELDRKTFELLKSYDIGSLETIADFLGKLARLR